MHALSVVYRNFQLLLQKRESMYSTTSAKHYVMAVPMNTCTTGSWEENSEENVLRQAIAINRLRVTVRPDTPETMHAPGSILGVHHTDLSRHEIYDIGKRLTSQLQLSSWSWISQRGQTHNCS